MARPLVSRRTHLAGLGGAAALPAVLGAACAAPAGREPAAPAALDRQATLQVLVDLGAAAFPLFEGVVDRWRSAHPQGPGLEWAAGGGTREMLGKIQTGLAAGTPPDLVQLEASDAVALSARGQLLALDPYLKRDRYDLVDFFERSHPQFDWRGRKYGLNKGMSNQSLYVNRTLFDQAGVVPPPTRADAGGWGFDAFLTAADRLTRREGSDTAQWGFLVGRDLRGGWLQWVATNGGAVFDPDFTRCLLGEARALEALQFLQDLMHKYRVAPTPKDEAAAGGAMAMFVNAGTVAMRINPVSGIDAHRRATFRWDHAVNPRGKGGRATTGGGQGWLILAATKHREEAWALLQHATGAESVRQMATVWYPPRKSVLTWLAAQDPQLPPESRHVGPEGQDLLVFDPIFPAFNEIRTEVIAPELNALWEGQKTAAQVADTLVPKVNAAIKAQG